MVKGLPDRIPYSPQAKQDILTMDEASNMPLSLFHQIHLAICGGNCGWLTLQFQILHIDDSQHPHPEICVEKSQKKTLREKIGNIQLHRKRNKNLESSLSSNFVTFHAICVIP